MKTDIHPKNYRPVVFQDTNNGTMFLIPSCIETSETVKYTDGNEYPLYKMEISSASHPFYTGVKMTVDTAGRIEKFEAQRKKAEAAKEEMASQKPKARKRNIEDKVNEELQRQMDKERKEEEKLQKKIKKVAGKTEEENSDAEEATDAEAPTEEAAQPAGDDSSAGDEGSAGDDQATDDDQEETNEKAE